MTHCKCFPEMRLTFVNLYRMEKFACSIHKLTNTETICAYPNSIWMKSRPSRLWSWWRCECIHCIDCAYNEEIRLWRILSFRKRSLKTISFTNEELSTLRVWRLSLKRFKPLLWKTAGSAVGRLNSWTVKRLRMPFKRFLGPNGCIYFRVFQWNDCNRDGKSKLHLLVLRTYVDQ